MINRIMDAADQIRNDKELWYGRYISVERAQIYVDIQEGHFENSRHT
jgi:hypothetical protein